MTRLELLSEMLGFLSTSQSFEVDPRFFDGLMVEMEKEKGSLEVVDFLGNYKTHKLYRGQTGLSPSDVAYELEKIFLKSESEAKVILQTETRANTPPALAPSRDEAYNRITSFNDPQYYLRPPRQNNRRVDPGWYGQMFSEPLPVSNPETASPPQGAYIDAVSQSLAQNYSYMTRLVRGATSAEDSANAAAAALAQDREQRPSSVPPLSRPSRAERWQVFRETVRATRDSDEVE